jgi:hypothetical protein
MSPEMQAIEHPYTLKIETPSGQTVTVPIAFLTREEIKSFLQSDFQRLAQEAGMKGSRVHIEQAVTTDYNNVLQDVASYLQRAVLKKAG